MHDAGGMVRDAAAAALSKVGLYYSIGYYYDSVELILWRNYLTKFEIKVSEMGFQ